MFSPHHSLPFGSRSSDDNLPNEFKKRKQSVSAESIQRFRIDNLSLKYYLLKLFSFSHSRIWKKFKEIKKFIQYRCSLIKIIKKALFFF